MPDKASFAEKLLDRAGRNDDAASFTKERQLTAQAFNLHVEKRDGRHSEGFAWSHYAGYQWTDEGEKEKLVMMFGPRAIEIEGHNLGALVAEIREGQLNLIRELTTAQATLKHANAEKEPVISSIRTYPSLEEMLKELKGGNERETGGPRRSGR